MNKIMGCLLGLFGIFAIENVVTNIIKYKTYKASLQANDNSKIEESK